MKRDFILILHYKDKRNIKKFIEGDMSLERKSGSGTVSAVKNETLRIVVEAKSLQSTHELSASKSDH